MPFLLFGRKRSRSLAKTSPKAAKVSRAEAAFAPEFHRMYPRARKYAAAFVGDFTADDVAQEAFVDLWDACYADGDVSLEPVDTVLFRILRRRIVDHLRRRDREARRDESYVIDITSRLEHQLDASAVAEGNILESRIAYIVEALPVQTRRVYKIAAANGWDARAAANELGISYNTARWHLLEATRTVRESLERDGYDVPATLPRGRRNRGGT